MLTPYFCIGEVLKPQGIRGEAKIKSYARDAGEFLKWKTLYVREQDGWTPVAAKCSRVQGDFAYVTLEGCTRPEDVEKRRGQALYIDRAHAAPLPEGMVYIADLMDCRALDETGAELGILTDVLQHGPTDVYVFRGPDGRTWMAPALPDAFPEKDVAAGIIRVNSERLKEVAVYED